MPRIAVVAFGLCAGQCNAQLAPDAEPSSTLPTLFVPRPRAVDAALLEASEAEKWRTLKTLERIVRVESGTGDKVGLAQLAAMLASELRAVGARVTLHPARNGVVGDNVVGVLKGSGGARILLMAHMDTVYPRGTLAKAPWRVDGDKAYGPGIGDAKSGIAVILGTLRVLKARRHDRYDTLTVLFNCDEEQGSRGSKDLIEGLAKASDVVFSYEPTLASPEGLTLSTSGIGAVNVTIKGVAAHAGVNPEAGASALLEASDFASRTRDLDQGPGKLRLTWTRLSAGSVDNIVPDSATMYADVRYPTKEALDALTAELKQRAATTRVPRTTIDIEVGAGRPPFNADADSRDLIQDAVDIYASLGHQLAVAPSIGGGTDAGYAMVAGKPIIEALGLPGFGYHANVGEWIRVDAIPRRLYLSSQMIIDAGRTR